jgi:hypothetical protein
VSPDADEIGKKGPAKMIISIVIPDNVAREAQNRKLPVEEFVDMLIDKGMETINSRPTVSNAIERIRALHSDVAPPLKPRR